MSDLEKLLQLQLHYLGAQFLDDTQSFVFYELTCCLVSSHLISDAI